MASLEDAVKQNNHELVEAILGGWAPRDDGYSNSTNGEENSVHTPDDFGDTVLIWATQQGDEEMCGLLLGAGASMLQGAKTDGDTPLHRAVKFHHHHMVKFFMQRSSPAERRELNQLKNMKNMTALHYAGKYGYDEIAELLINSGGADSLSVDETGRTAVDYAAENDHELCEEVLRDPEQARLAAAEKERAAQAQADNDFMLEAAELGDVGWTRELLARGANIHHRDAKTGNQPLHIAARLSHEPLSKFLVENGADPIIPNKAGHTPQHMDTGLQWFQAQMEQSDGGGNQAAAQAHRT